MASGTVKLFPLRYLPTPDPDPKRRLVYVGAIYGTTLPRIEGSNDG